MCLNKKSGIRIFKLLPINSSFVKPNNKQVLNETFLILPKSSKFAEITNILL